MKYILILMTFLLVSCISEKQLSKETSQKSTIVQVKQTEKPFPQNWYGKWRGTLTIYNSKGKAQDVPMEIHIEPTDSVNRTKMALIYGEDEKIGTRPYELITIDAEKGHYQTDEKNTIFLDDYYFSGVLYSRFEVMGNLLLTRIEKRNNKLYFEVISGKAEPINTTGGDEANKIPDVNSYNIFVSQRAELVKY